MKHMKNTALRLSLGFAALAATAFGQGTYEIDSSHSSAQFSVKHLMISNVKGEFTKVTGTFVYDPKNVSASQIDATIDVNTINTRDAKRDAHLKNPDFFDAAKYPTLTFKSKQVWKSGSKLQAKGDLTMHGVTKEIVLDIEGPTAETKDPWGNVRVGATATAKINRKDWGLNWNKALETGGVMVGEEVILTIDIEGVRKSPAKASN
jgi:polyisoprenoid-binding protein YceI